MPTRPAQPKVQRVGRMRLTDLAYTELREAIVTGRLAMGEHLVETRLADELGISRAPLREALQRLAKDGLVRVEAHRGVFVTELTASDVADLYNVRLALETTGLRLFMRRGAATRRLHDQLRQMQRAADRGDRSAVVSAEFEFHHAIAESAGNPLLLQLYHDISGRLMLSMALDDANIEALQEIVDEHVPIVDAIESDDEPRAVAIFEEHLVSTVGKLLERLGGEPASVLGPLPAARRRRATPSRSGRRA